MISVLGMLGLELPEDFEYESIVDCVLDSIKCNAVDYCFTRRDMKAIFTKAKEAGYSIFYKEVLEKDGSVDYYQIVPAKFYKRGVGDRELVENFCCNVTEIPMEYQCVIIRKGHNYVFKNFNEPPKRI